MTSKPPQAAPPVPTMASSARRGIVGWADNGPPSLTAASDGATLGLFGYDPMRYYTGRAPLEARAMGINLGPEDFAVRCNLVHAPGDVMADFTAGQIGNEEGAALSASLQEKLGGRRSVQGATGPVEVELESHSGVSYRTLFNVR